LYSKCQSQLRELFIPIDKKTIEFKYNFEDTKAMQQDINDVFTNYEKNARGPAKLKVLTKNAPKNVQKIFDCVARNAGEKKRKMESEYKIKLTELENRCDILKQDLNSVQEKEKTNAIRVIYIAQSL